MTSRDRNTHARPVVALFLATVLAVALQACGGGQQSAQSIVKDTFNSRQQINSGQLNLAFNLDANGLQGVSAPIAVQVSGPFQSTSPTKLPRFALNIDLGTGGHALKAGAISTKSQFFVTLAGEAFVAPASTRDALQSSYAQASKAASSHKSVSTFASLGLDPGHWLEHPVLLGTQEMAGVKTIHISAGLNLARFLADADKLSGASGSLGITQQQVPGLLSRDLLLGDAEQQVSGLLSPGESQALVSSLTSARVDLYTGASDHLLRSLTVHAALSSNATNRKLLQGLRSATLNLRLQITNLNENQKIAAPSNPRPLSDLVSALQQQGLLSPNQASGSSEASSTPGSTSGSSSAHARCAESAGQSVVALQKCASLLKG